MRKDTSFSDRKLTADEFSQKYWRSGETPYQYHTGSIEDGRDEREQFIFNNIRAIWERTKQKSEENRCENAKMWYWIRKHERKLERLTLMANISLALTVVQILWNKRR